MFEDYRGIHDRIADKNPFLRTDGSLSAALLLLQTAAFIGATLCGIIDPHGYAVRLFSVFVFFVPLCS